MTVLAAHADTKLVGTPIGSKPANAFDGSVDTYVQANESSNAWAGLDLGTPHVITRIGWAPRNNSAGPNYCLLGVFEASNDPTFIDAVPLYLIDNGGRAGQFSYADVNVTRGFRYVRYVGPHNSYCQMAELEFYGHEGEGDDSHFYQITNLPTLSYHTDNGRDPTSKTTEMDASMVLVYENGTLIQEYPILARCRGNASYGFDKKPYRIKFNDGKSHHMLHGSALESPAKAKKWTLINNYGDKTLMRNIVAFEVSRRMKMPYTPWCQPVDVIVNGEYKGCYQLCDQVAVDGKRVDVTEMTPEDNEGEALTGGYLIEVDNNAGSEPSKFYSKRGTPVTIKSPDADAITDAQHKYIENYFNQMEASVWSSKLSEEPADYTQYLDVESYLRNLIVGEYCGNTDTFHSTYMSKEQGVSQFVTGPIWDHDLSFDNDNRTYPINNHHDWIFRTGGTNAGDMAGFTNRILSDPYASGLMKAMWAEARDSSIITAANMVAYVDSVEKVLMASQRLNFMRWPILGQYVHMNAFAYPTYAQEVDMVRKCVRNRVEWMDNMLGYNGGSIDPAPTDSSYVIRTPEDLILFAKNVNGGATLSNAVLDADIDMEGYNDDFEPIGSNYGQYAGTFDGQGHIISNLHIDSYNQFVGLFGAVAGGVVIKNLTLDSSCSISGNAYVGLIGGSNSSGEVRLSCLGNEGTVTAAAQNAGGIIGCNMGSSASWIIDNCYVTGEVTGGLESATLSGWVGSNAVVSNCYSIAQVSGTDSNRYFYRGEGTFTNCYDLFGGHSIQTTDLASAKSGELGMLLNQGKNGGVWHQTLDVDEHPVLNDGSMPLFVAGDVFSNGLIVAKRDEKSAWEPATIDGHDIILRDGRYAYYTLPFSAPGNMKWGATSVKYSRTFGDETWQCWYVPFDYTVTANTYNDYEFARFDGIYADRNGTPYATFVQLEGRQTLKANTPYLIKALGVKSKVEKEFSAGIRSLKENESEIISFTADTLTYTLCGLYSALDYDADMPCYVISKGRFMPLKEGEKAQALRFVLFVTTEEGTAPSTKSRPRFINVRITEEGSEVTTLPADPSGPIDVYDLQGRKVTTIECPDDINALGSGIYIIDGKKIKR